MTGSSVSCARWRVPDEILPKRKIRMQPEKRQELDDSNQQQEEAYNSNKYAGGLSLDSSSNEAEDVIAQVAKSSDRRL